MDTLHWMIAASLGLGLATSVGLNACLPLLLLACASHFHLAGVRLNDHFAWLSSDASLIVLGFAAALEIVGDKVPAIEHILKALGLVLRPAAGTLAAASVFTHTDPTTAAVMGLIVGAPSSFGFHAATSDIRVASSVTTMGCLNPILSVIEDLAAVLLTILGMLAPLLVPLVVVGLGLLLWKAAKVAKRKMALRRSPQGVPVTT